MLLTTQPAQTKMTDYTLNDHAKAVQELARLHEKWENYSGNNPHKFRADIETAKATLARVERALKDIGVLSRTAQEERDATLDKAYPNALSRQIVQWEGQRFQKRYTSLATSLSGKTVRAWKGFWLPLVD